MITNAEELEHSTGKAFKLIYHKMSKFSSLYNPSTGIKSLKLRSTDSSSILTVVKLGTISSALDISYFTTIGSTINETEPL